MPTSSKRANDGTTHWEGCEQAHHKCALIWLERDRSLLSQARSWLANVSGALVDSGVEVPDESGYGEAVRKIVAERDALRLARDEFQALSQKWARVAANQAERIEQTAERDAALCPEDVGISEYVDSLLRRAEAAEKERKDELAATAREIARRAFVTIERDTLAAQVAALREALSRFKWAAAPEQHRGTSAYPYEEIVDVLADTESAARAHDEKVRREALEQAARIADEHRERAKSMQSDLLKRRDPVYGVGSADSARWDQYQHGAGAAAAIAAAIRALLAGEEKASCL
jgi:hypothetical protein